jgi:hypothetical protein
MARYEIRIHGPDGDHKIVWNGDHPDDLAALSSALEICRNQQVEVWDDHRQIGAISLEGTPRLTM